MVPRVLGGDEVEREKREEGEAEEQRDGALHRRSSRLLVAKLYTELFL